jgi:hypothetical protein
MKKLILNADFLLVAYFAAASLIASVLVTLY